MTYTEFVKHVAANAEVTQAAAKRVLDEAGEAIAEALRRGEEIPFATIGKFKSKMRGASVGRNVHTGELIQVAPKRVASFAVGSRLKMAINA